MGGNTLLGKGTYGCVYEVDMAGEKRAMKYFVCRKNQLHLNNLQEMFVNCKVRNVPNLVHCFKISLDDPTSYLADDVFKSTNIGPLSIMMTRYDCDMCTWVHKTWNPQHLCEIAHKVTKGLCHLDSLGIIHRDIKPTNIFMKKNEPFLGDFGLTVVYNGVDKLSSVVSQINYRAPEMIVKKQYDYKVDIWALGVVIYFLFHRDSLFSMSNEDKLQDQLLHIYSRLPDWRVPTFVMTKIKKKLTSAVYILPETQEAELRMFQALPCPQDHVRQPDGGSVQHGSSPQTQFLLDHGTRVSEHQTAEDLLSDSPFHGRLFNSPFQGWQTAGFKEVHRQQLDPSRRSRGEESKGGLGYRAQARLSAQGHIGHAWKRRHARKDVSKENNSSSKRPLLLRRHARSSAWGPPHALHERRQSDTGSVQRKAVGSRRSV